MPLLNNTCHSAGLIYTEPIGGNTGWGEKYSGACGLLVGELTVIVKLQLVSRPQLSVAMQVMYFKYTKKRYGEGRRILRMAPLHHHYEQKGWKETQVVVRFWIITMMLVLAGLSTLKLR